MADRTVTVGASGKMYTTPALAVAGEPDFQTGEDNIVFVVDAGSYGRFGIAPDKFTTSSSHKVKFQCATGVSHSLARATGVRIINSTEWNACFNPEVTYTEIYGFAFSNPMTNGAYGVTFPAANCLLYGCLFYDCRNDAVRFTPSSGSCYIINSAIINCSGGIYSANSHTGYIYNVTCINSDTYGFYHTGYGTRNLKNCYFGGSGTADYYKASTGTVNLTTCRSSDGTLSTTIVSLANCGFTSYTDGSEDVHISSSSSLRDIGTDLSSDSVYAFSTDCLGNTRSGSWDIGAVDTCTTNTDMRGTDSALLAANYTAPNNSGITGIKAKTDQLTFTEANKVDATATVSGAGLATEAKQDEIISDIAGVITHGDSNWLTPSGIGGTISITFNVKDDSGNNVLDAVVEVWDTAGRTLKERKETNSSGNAVFNCKAESYTIKITKSGYSFTDILYTVTIPAVKNYVMTAFVIPVSPDLTKCRVWMKLVNTYTSLTVTADVPENLTGNNLVMGNYTGVYDIANNLVYWDLPIGALNSVLKITELGFEVVVPLILDLESSELKDLI